MTGTASGASAFSTAGIAGQVQSVLDEAVLGFLALLSLFLGIAPAVFPLSTAALTGLVIAEFVVVGLFALEYLAGLARADSKRAFASGPWRVLDALIIAAALVSALPAVHGALRSSPALRLLRLGRLALLGTRSSAAVAAAQQESILREPEPVSRLEAQALVDGPQPRFESMDWQTVLERVASAEEDWIFVSGVGPEQVGPLAAALGVPEPALRRKLLEATFPRLDRLEGFAALFALYPEVVDGRVQRTRLLLVGSAQNVVVLTRRSTPLSASVAQRLEEVDASLPPLVRATMALVTELLRAYGQVVDHLEARLLRIESAEGRTRDQEFLSQTFLLRSEISRVRGNLRHLKEVVSDLARNRLAIRGFETPHRPLFQLLSDDAEDLYAAIDDVREGLAALVDLRLNVSSFQMNKVMRLLALLTALALIPSVAGGLLGMNLAGSPWEASLAQVAFGVAAGMALSLYIFAVKGWMR